VESLHHPLGKLLGSAAVGALGELVLLDASDRLTDAAIEVDCDFTEALFTSEDPSESWLPPWACQRAEQVQRGVLERLLSSVSRQNTRLRGGS
jgi:hypothetical protein